MIVLPQPDERSITWLKQSKRLVLKCHNIRQCGIAKMLGIRILSSPMRRNRQDQTITDVNIACKYNIKL